MRKRVRRFLCDFFVVNLRFFFSSVPPLTGWGLFSFKHKDILKMVEAHSWQITTPEYSVLMIFSFMAEVVRNYFLSSSKNQSNYELNGLSRYSEDICRSNQPNLWLFWHQYHMYNVHTVSVKFLKLKIHPIKSHENCPWKYADKDNNWWSNIHISSVHSPYPILVEILLIYRSCSYS